MYFVLMGDMKPLEQVFHIRGKAFNLSKESTCKSHRCEVNTVGILPCNFSMLLKALKGIHFRKSLTEFELSDQF